MYCRQSRIQLLFDRAPATALSNKLERCELRRVYLLNAKIGKFYVCPCPSHMLTRALVHDTAILIILFAVRQSRIDINGARWRAFCFVFFYEWSTIQNKADAPWYLNKNLEYHNKVHSNNLK